MMRQSWQTTIATPLNRSAAKRCSELGLANVENAFVDVVVAGLPLPL